MRAVVFRPAILLLDEPFSALDRHLVEQLQAELWELRDQLRIAIVLITHDSPFALSISDHLLILRDGQVEQMGAPAEVFERPQSAFAAKFLGPVNFIRVGPDPARASETGAVAAPACAPAKLLALRPPRVKIGLTGPAHARRGTVKKLHYHGSCVAVEIWLEPAESVLAEVSADEAARLSPEERIWVWWNEDDAMTIPPQAV